MARFGGDEFVVLCDAAADARVLCERLPTCSAMPFMLNNEDYFLTASIGIAEADSVTGSPGDLVHDADTAMYRAKEQGRGRMAVSSTKRPGDTPLTAATPSTCCAPHSSATS